MRYLLFAFPLIASTIWSAETTLQKLTYKHANGKTLPYQAYVPSEIKADQKVPLILFLHGAGERGTDNKRQTIHGVPQLVKHSQTANQPAVIVAPQCPKGKQWVNTPWGAKSHTMPKAPSIPMTLAIGLVAECMKKYAIDPQRVYIVGLSMGGYGTWDALQRNPNRFAAAVPVCGGADSALATTIAHIPVWTWHGDKDRVVPTTRSRDIVAALKKAGGTPKYTELKGVGHNAWTPAFKSTEMLNWLFAQRKK